MSELLPRRRGRRPAMRISVDLPMAPNASRNSEAFKAWTAAATTRLQAMSFVRLKGTVCVKLRCGLTDQKHITSALTSAIDLLARRGLIDSSAAPVDLFACWDPSIEPARMSLCVHETLRPEHRASQMARQKLRDLQHARLRARRASTERGRAA